MRRKLLPGDTFYPIQLMMYISFFMDGVFVYSTLWLGRLGNQSHITPWHLGSQAVSRQPSGTNEAARDTRNPTRAGRFFTNFELEIGPWIAFPVYCEVICECQKRKALRLLTLTHAISKHLDTTVFSDSSPPCRRHPSF